jgi:hypothetical protein
MKQNEEKQRKQFEQKFPKSIAEYRLKPRTMQPIIARILTTTGIRREKLIREQSWHPEDTIPLQTIYNTNVRFSI